MKIILFLLLIFYSKYSFAENNFDQVENSHLKKYEFEIAWGGIFKGAKNIIKKTTKIPKKNNNIFKNKLDPKNVNDGWFPMPAPHLIARAINELREERPEIYDEIKTWNCPSHIEDDTSLTIDEKEMQCAGYHLTCNVRVHTNVALGSGFLINRNTIITNYHVIENNELNIKTSSYFNDKKVNAKLIASDKNLDLAALKIMRGFGNDKNLKICELAKLIPKLGDVAIAIGHPQGESDFHISKGNINAFFDFSYKPVNNDDSSVHWLNINTPIGPGSSGGPLYSKGYVIGVNTGGIPNTNINYSLFYKKLEIFLKENKISQDNRSVNSLNILKIEPVQKFNRILK